MTTYEKPDFWSLKAHKEDYPARSVYKLKEIDEKFNFFRPLPPAGIRVLDLGAAPGSWSLYIVRRYGSLPGMAVKPGGSTSPVAGPPGAFFLAATDLLPLSHHFDRLGGEAFFYVQGDFTGDAVRDELIRRGPYSAIVSDAAPGTTGSRTVDTLRSLALAEEALSYAERCLTPGGNLAVKVFQGGDTAALLKRMREHFTTARSFKPAACRGNSFETYYIGLEKRSL
jgi:23S rRNA (uridine2552-2'-O)-methyltransferase